MFDNTIKLYNNDNYYDIKKVNPILLKTLNQVNNKKALDIGCGRGVNASFMQAKGYDVSAIDINEKALNYIKDKKIKIIKQDIRKYKFENNYDLISSFYSLQHIPFLDSKLVLDKAISKLNLKGLLIIAIFENRKSAINSIDIINYFKNKKMKLILENKWIREDSDHGEKHTHEGYYCIYQKIKTEI